MNYLKQATAGQAFLFGPFLDDTDFKTAETGLTIANTDIRVSKAGADTIAKASGGGTHDEAGFYTVTFDADDSSVVGILDVNCKVAGALPVWRRFQVVEEAIYDDMFAASSDGFGDTQALVVTADTAIDVAVGDLANGTDGLTALKAAIDAIPTTMVGTDNAALASVVGALADGAAAGEVTTADTLMQYLKQLINILIGNAGIVTFKAGAAPADAVSMSEVLRAIYDDSNAIQGKLPANKFMGSSDGADDDGTLNSIASDASSAASDASTIAGKLPANNMMGSSDGADDDGTLNTIASDAAAIAAKLPANKFMGSSDGVDDDGTLNTIASDAAAIAGKLPANKFMGSSDGADDDGTLNTIASDAAAIAGKLPANKFMGSSDGADDDGNINTAVSGVADIQGRLPDALVSGNIKSNALAFAGDTAAPVTLAASLSSVVIGAAETGTLSTTEMTTNLTEVTVDHYINRAILWTSGPLSGQTAKCTAYSATGKLTFTDTTDAPLDGNTFVLL